MSNKSVTKTKKRATELTIALFLFVAYYSAKVTLNSNNTKNGCPDKPNTHRRKTDLDY